MKNSTHQKLIIELKNKYFNLEIFKSERLETQFNIVSASLLNFLPHISTAKHEEIFRNILLHQRLSAIEQAMPELLKNVVIKNFPDELLNGGKGNAAIICTFHLGSYRLINLLLTTRGIPFSLVIAKRVINKQGNEFKTLFRNLSGAFQTSGFGIIDAEEPSCAITMLRDLKNGKSLVVYIDGNTGAGDQTSINENCTVIPFLHQQITVRTGIGFLAHASDRPILPVLCYRDPLDKISLSFSDAIYPNKNEERIVFAQKSIAKLYEIAGPFIKNFPEQWESWLYLHKVAHIINPIELFQDPAHIFQSALLFFNTAQYGLIKRPPNYYLFNKTNYLSYPLEKTLFSMLKKAIKRPLNTKIINVNLLSELYKNSALITA